ncbi:MAG TPA: hypothetical protein VJ978_12475, partial [Nitriliruptoraceae bacterium]|nr:hypothetical protein [Nitriliruptoraceae bacterium]
MFEATQKSWSMGGGTGDSCEPPAATTLICPETTSRRPCAVSASHPSTSTVEAIPTMVRRSPIEPKACLE